MDRDTDEALPSGLDLETLLQPQGRHLLFPKASSSLPCSGLGPRDSGVTVCKGWRMVD